MAKLSMTTELKVPADEVCKLVGGFNALPDWHPAVAESHTERAGEVLVWQLSLAGGGTIVERLEALDEDERLYNYAIIDSPLPVSDYSATIRVRDKGDGTVTTVGWSSEFRPCGAPESEAREIIQGVYNAGLENPKKIFGG